ncbi:MAG: beta-lactamase family protein [Tabrizicola sp.]|nr:beta-lactamase family protein [Tabrizicola sp.]
MTMQRRTVLAGAAAMVSAPIVRAQSSADSLAEDFLSNNGLPGVTWAVRRSWGETFQGAAGYADPEAGERMTPDHRMRIASISKTITAAMILTLEAEEQLWVGHRPFASDGVFRDLVDETLPWLPLLEEITLDHLLTHTSGGWPNTGHDPMFWDLDLDHFDLIRKTLVEMPPDTLAGSTYAYSNFGYCLLGRVIEAATGMDCTSAVQAWLADPVGATSFALAGDELADRLPGEVVYVASGGDPYGLRASRMDSNGGWVMTAGDLLAILAGFDGAGDDAVPHSVAERMAEPYFAEGTYGRGLILNPAHGNRWHNGSLPGLTSFAVMLENGDLVCAIANGRTDTSRAAIETLVFDIYGNVAG